MIPKPTTICERCAAAPFHTEPATGIVWFYCSHSQAGGLYVAGWSCWQVFSPIERDTFDISLRAAVQVIVQQTALQAKAEPKN